MVTTVAIVARGMVVRNKTNIVRCVIAMYQSPELAEIIAKESLAISGVFPWYCWC